MSRNNRDIAKSNTVSFLLVLTISTGGFAALFNAVSTMFHSIGSGLPYVFVSLFMFPILFALSLLQNVGEIREMDDITDSERNRLKVVVKTVQRRLKLAVFTLFSFGIVSVSCLYLSSLHVFSISTGLTIIGGMLGAEVVILYALINLRNSAQDCKANIKERMIALKNTRKLHQRLQQP